MGLKGSQIILAAVVVVLLGIVAFSIVYDGEEENHDQDVDLVGYWYLIDSESFDGNSRIYKTLNHNFDMDIKGISDCLFYGSTRLHSVSDDVMIAGFFDGDNFLCEYTTDYGYVKAIGYTYDGDLFTKEMHYYDTSSDSQWFVTMNVYSKNADSDSSVIHVAPDLYFGWTAWEGYSLNKNGTYDLDGTLFRITKQSGDFIRVEMEQTEYGKTIIKALNGVIVSENEFDGIPGYTIYMMENTGTIWNVYMTANVLILKTVTTSELLEIEGEPVAVERIYRNSSILGTPVMMDVPTDMMGVWNSTETKILRGNGVESHDLVTLTLDYNVIDDAAFAGNMVQHHESQDLSGVSVGYSAMNIHFSSGFICHTMIQIEATGTISYGYMIIDGDEAILITFWFDSEYNTNGVTKVVLQKG